MKSYLFLLIKRVQSVINVAGYSQTNSINNGGLPVTGGGLIFLTEGTGGHFVVQGGGSHGWFLWAVLVTCISHVIFYGILEFLTLYYGFFCFQKFILGIETEKCSAQDLGYTKLRKPTFCNPDLAETVSFRSFLLFYTK